MSRFFLVLVVFVYSYKGISQVNNRWKPYFSYNNIKVISKSKFGFIAGAENAIFSKDVKSQNFNTITTVEGLSGKEISALYYSENTKKIVVGFENGLIQILDGGNVLNIVDIQNKVSITSSKKKINQFFEDNGLLYISADFGVLVYNLVKSEFVETYFLGDAGTETEINQVAIYNGYLYVATASKGVKRIQLSNTTKVDYNQWEEFLFGYWRDIEIFGDKLIILNSDKKIYIYDGATVWVQGEESSDILTSSVSKNHYTIVTAKNISIYDLSLNKIQNILSDIDDYKDAIVIDDKVYVGTKSSGLFEMPLDNPSLKENITPSGPAKNRIFSLKSTANKLWAVFGDYNEGYNPYPLDEYGVDYFTYRGEWSSIPYSNLLGAKSIVNIAVNPKDEENVFLSSYFSGLLELKNGVVVNLYDNTNSSLESLFDPKYPQKVDIRISSPVFDNQGNLWMNNSFIKNGLKMKTPSGEWKSYLLSELNSQVTSSFGKLIIDKNGTKWICSNKSGLIGINESIILNTATNKYKEIKITEGNLPIDDARVAAIDQNNQMWIGTTKGLRILNNIDSFMSQSSLKTTNIVILDDGLAQELMYEQYITDIIVDGANRKWISTADSGLFYFSNNGQQTIYHFTTNNSPLPSNSIVDIELNDKTGELFIATDKGMVSFQTNVTDSNNNFDNVLVYPNPVRPNYTGLINVTGLIDKSNIKITDISGNLVYQATAEGGTVQWDGTAFGQYKVASGVYMVFISNEDGTQTDVKKVMIVR